MPVTGTIEEHRDQGSDVSTKDGELRTGNNRMQHYPRESDSFTTPGRAKRIQAIALDELSFMYLVCVELVQI